MQTRFLWTLALVVHIQLAGLAGAQSSSVSTPFHTGSNSFFEQVGTNFGFQTSNFFFQQNSFGLATPPFGGYTPNAVATFGFSTPIPGGHAYFNISAGQGSQASLVSQAPSATLANGVQGGFFDTTQTPFVTSTFPAAGNVAGTDGPLGERLQRLQQEAPRAARVSQSGADSSADHASGPVRTAFESRLAAAQASSAGRPTLSVTELRDLRGQQAATEENARQQAAQALAARGAEAEQAGKWSVARLYYEQAARRAAPPARDELLARARSLADPAVAKKTTRSSKAKP